MPAVASAGLSPGLTATAPDGSAISVSSPFSTTTAAERRAASRTWLQTLALDLGAVDLQQAGELARVRREHRRGGLARTAGRASRRGRSAHLRRAPCTCASAASAARELECAGTAPEARPERQRRRRARPLRAPLRSPPAPARRPARASRGSSAPGSGGGRQHALQRGRNARGHVPRAGAHARFARPSAARP